MVKMTSNPKELFKNNLNISAAIASSFALLQIFEN